MKKANLILISIDTLRADEVGSINPEVDSLTPNIDNFAKTGTAFKKFYSQGPNTRAAFPPIMTSTYPLMFGDYRKVGIRPRVSFVEILRRNGYATAGFHSNPYLSKNFGYDRGFDIFFDGIAENSQYTSAKNILKKNKFVFGIIKGVYSQFKKATEKKLGNKAPYTPADTIVDMGEKYISNTNNPFFLWLHLMDAHMPYPGEGEKFFERINQHRRGEVEITDEELKTHRKLRYDRIRFIDGKIGELINFLKDKKLLKDTFMFICSDHGEELLEHGDLEHRDKFYEELIHVPFVTNYPGCDPDSLHGNIDIPATILEASGIVIPKIFMGRSLRKRRDSVFSEVIDRHTNHRKICIINNHWKLTTDTGNASENSELYRLDDDPNEKIEVSSTNRDVVNELLSDIDAHNQAKKEIERKTLLLKALKI